jgi:putative component of toxin-antitoxin plasmid stabilization module
MRYEIEKIEIFDKWLLKLRDRKAVLAITQRLDRAIVGNFGDVAPAIVCITQSVKTP